MKLLLTSNGLTSPELEQAFAELTGERTGLRIVIIPTASDPIEWVPEAPGSKKYVAKIDTSRVEKNRAWLHAYVKSYKDKGYEVALADLKEGPEAVWDKLKDADVIEATGGDVNYLLDWAKKAKLGDFLKDLLDRGAVFYGSSAGNGILMPDIGLTWWDPIKWEGEDHAGFGIVDFVMAVHQKESDVTSNEKNLIERKKFMQSKMNFPWRVYLVKDGQAIKVDGDKIEHIGPGEKKWI